MESRIVEIDHRKPYRYRGHVLGYVVLTRAEVCIIIKELAQAIYNSYARQKVPVVFIYVTNGGTWFHTKLREELMRLGFPLELALDENLAAASYRGTDLAEVAVAEKFPPESLKGFCAVVVEDIIDTGNTLGNILHQIMLACPESLEVCALLKRANAFTLVPKYLGVTLKFEEWVIGLGLDLQKRARFTDDGVLIALSPWGKKYLLSLPEPNLGK